LTINSAPPPPAAKLLFKSGFEQGTSLQVPAGNMQGGANSVEQLLNGTDNSTGYDWSALWGLYGSDLALDGIHLIPGDGQNGNPFSSVFLNALDPTEKRTGSQSLLMNVSGFSNPNCNPACGQDTFNVTGTLSVNSFYERVWVKLPPEFLTQAQSYSSWWRSFFAFKSSSNHRWEAYIYRNSGINGGQPYWHTHSDDLTDSHAYSQTYWTQENTTVPVPINQWFQMEIYFKLSSGSDGRYFWAITDPNGVSHTLADQQGPNFTASTSGEYIHGLYLMNMYGSNWPMKQWLDDLEVWDSPPCASLPCGPGTGGTPPAVPVITSAGTATATAGSAFSYQITATNNPSSYNATGLPAGLSVDANAGLISGTPTSAGTANIILSATNSGGTGTATLSLTINSAPPPPTASPIDPSRSIDWNQAGIPGGIPNRTTQCGPTIAAYGTSGSPASPATINNAIAACPGGQFVSLGTGTFYLNGGIDFGGKSNVTVRGAGADATFIHFTGAASCNGLQSDVCMAGANSGPGWEQKCL